MGKVLSIIGVIVTGAIFFIVGLIPGERVISSCGADSYILIGIARSAVQLTAACEFLLGGAIVALWITVRNKFLKNP